MEERAKKLLIYACRKQAIEYINENDNVELESCNTVCCFSEKNEQCLKERGPFYKES